VSNEELAALLFEIADLLDLEGVRFKPEAYRRAARTLQSLPEDVSDLLARGRLREVPGIGEALEEKIREYVRTGRISYLDRLRSSYPPGILDLLRLEGVGPKTAGRFFREFQITNLSDLEKALDEGRLEGQAGIGARRIELWRAALRRIRETNAAGTPSSRLALAEAQRLADLVLGELKASRVPWEQVSFAGSLRRRKETVGDLDLVISSSDPGKVMDAFVHLPSVAEVRLHGETRSTVRLRDGVQVDLRVVPDPAFGAALQYFTGSKDHNIRLRTLGIQKGIKINEYGLTREGGELLPAPREEDVYAAVGLPWIPPEIREDQGEIDLAQKGSLPGLVSEDQVRQEWHVHLPASSGEAERQEWVLAARRGGLATLGFVVRAEELARGTGEWRGLSQELRGTREGVATYLGLEGSPRTLQRILPALDPPADYLVIVPERTGKSGDPPGGPASDRENFSLPTFFSHLETSEDPKASPRPPPGSDAGPKTGVQELAVTEKDVIPPASQVRAGGDRGVRWILSGRPRIPEELDRLRLAVGIARRAWLLPTSVVNTHFLSQEPSAPTLPGTSRPPPPRSLPRLAQRPAQALRPSKRREKGRVETVSPHHPG
jgi:DNA polymerase/3'-5' exonuclease PolX